jgi:hypothetical protein
MRNLFNLGVPVQVAPCIHSYTHIFLPLAVAPIPMPHAFCFHLRISQYFLHILSSPRFPIELSNVSINFPKCTATQTSKFGCFNAFGTATPRLRDYENYATTGPLVIGIRRNIHHVAPMLASRPLTLHQNLVLLISLRHTCPSEYCRSPRTNHSNNTGNIAGHQSPAMGPTTRKVPVCDRPDQLRVLHLLERNKRA